jgi:hypothetical protein
MIGRRTFSAAVFALAAAATAPPAMAAGFWDDLFDGLGGGSDTMDGTSRAVDSIKRADYPQAERIKIIGEIDKLNDLLDRVLSTKAGFIDHMRDYIDRARQPGPFPASLRASMWNDVADDVTLLLGLVKDVQTMLSNSVYLRARLDAATRSGLSQVMVQRVDLLTDMRNVPPPRTADELAQLERIAARHRSLRERTAALQRSLFSARDRLADV